MSKKPYAMLTEAERWQWHTDVYAFRRVVLGKPVSDRTSPCDPDGDYFDEALIRVACARRMDKRERARRQREEQHDGWGRYREAAEYREAWAHQLGYKSFAQMYAIGLVAAVRDAPAYRV